VNPWLILGVVLAVGAAGGAGLYQGRELGMAKVQQEWDKERAAQEAAYAQAQAEARTKEQELQANADAIRQEKDREIRNLNARTTALTNSLRDRSERPTTEASAVPSTTTMDPLPPGVLEKNFTAQMESFLQGKLPEGTNSESSSSSAVTNTKH